MPVKRTTIQDIKEQISFHEAEAKKLTVALDALTESAVPAKKKGREKKKVAKKKGRKKKAGKKVKRKMSPEVRKKIAAAQKKRWAKQKGEK